MNFHQIVENGSLTEISDLLESLNIDDFVANVAAKFGRLDALELLRDRGYKFTTEYCQEAIKNGITLNCFIFLEDQCPEYFVDNKKVLHQLVDSKFVDKDVLTYYLSKR